MLLQVDKPILFGYKMCLSQVCIIINCMKTITPVSFVTATVGLCITVMLVITRLT